MNSYKTISSNVSLEIPPIKKSRFISHIFRIESECEVTLHLNELKSTFPDANHHCWAYSLIIDNKIRYNDDGEPSGSAGKPILSHIQGKEIFNVLIVVTRYFGGTKLGVGGLVRAYGQAAKEVLEKSTIVDVEPTSKFKLEYNYDETSNINIIFNKYNTDIVEESFTEAITQTVCINTKNIKDFIKDITSITKAKINIKTLE